MGKHLATLVQCRPATTKASSRIQPAATKPVRTTLAKIRQAVRKSMEEHAAPHDA